MKKDIAHPSPEHLGGKIGGRPEDVLEVAASGVSPADNACPLCAAPGRRLFARHGIGIAECLSCRHQYADFVPAAGHVEEHYADTYFFGGGAGYPDYLAEAGLLKKRGRRYAQIMARHTAPGRVLDVGAAAGFVLDGFRQMGWDATGLEPNPKMAQLARDHLQLDVVAETVERFRPTRLLDLICLLQVLPHLPDPAGAVAQMASWCRPRGYCLVETWDRSSWLAKLAGRWWHEYSPPTVLHFFTTARLDSLFAEHGFQRVARGRPGKWITAHHARSLANHVLQDLPLRRCWLSPLALLPGRLPLPYPAFDLFWTLYQRTPS